MFLQKRCLPDIEERSVTAKAATEIESVPHRVPQVDAEIYDETY